MEGNKLLNEQRDRKTNELQVTGTREIIDGKMVEVKKNYLVSLYEYFIIFELYNSSYFYIFSEYKPIKPCGVLMAD